MIVTSKEQAWLEVNKIFPTDYEKDYVASNNAGYDIYRHNSLNPYNKICDLGNRLEVTIGNEVTNIWIEAPKPTTFKTIVTYRIHNGKVMTKELTGVTETETVYERIGDEAVQIFKVRFGKYNSASWAADSILQVSMIPERN